MPLSLEASILYLGTLAAIGLFGAFFVETISRSADKAIKKAGG